MNESRYDKLRTELILQSLRTQYIGKEIIYFESTDSTNIRASLLGEKGCENGTLVVSETQTNGKGRLGREWFSPQHSNLYFSILLRPSISTQILGWISLASGVALSKGINSYTGLESRVKWPNDILVKGKKIGGILIETHIEGSRLSHLVLGVGINVNMTHFPKAIATLATSIKKELGHPIQREPLMVHLIEGIERQLEALYHTGPESLADEWKLLSDTIGQEVSVTIGEKAIQGRAIDIDPYGALILKKSDGETTRILAGDVVQLRRI
ncbi:MAG: biotin--[acetyl-CoA-carboxylase] ligase [Nitrospiria bacterium]